MKIILLLCALLFASSANAIIVIPDGQCDFEGRWLITKTNSIVEYYFIINEDTGGEKRFLVSNVNAAELKAAQADEKLFNLKLKLTNDTLSGDAKATILRINRKLQSQSAKVYQKADLEKVCTPDSSSRTPQSKK